MGVETKYELIQIHEVEMALSSVSNFYFITSGGFTIDGKRSQAHQAESLPQLNPGQRPGITSIF